MIRFLLLIPFFLLSLQIKAQEKIIIDLDLAYEEGMQAIAANQFQKAIDAFYECQREQPDNQDLISKLAYCYYRQGNYPEGKLYYRKLLQLDSTNISAISNLASIYEKELNYREAGKFYEHLLQIDSSNSYYFRQHGFLLKRQGVLLKAIIQFNKSHALNPYDLTVIDELAQLYLKLEALPYAMDFAKKGMALDSNNIRILYTTAKINNELKKDHKVIRLINRAMAQGDSTTYYQKMLSISYLQVDSIDAAIFYLNRIINKKQDSEHTHHYLALAYQKKENTEKSIFHFKQAIDKAISKRTSRYHGDLAAVYEMEKEYRKAINHYQAAYNYSGKARYLFFLARNQDLYYRDKNIAIRNYQKYLKTTDQQHRSYAQNRITQLKEIVHFQVKDQ